MTRRPLARRWLAAVPKGIAGPLGTSLQLLSHAIRLVGVHLDAAGRTLASDQPTLAYLPFDPPPARPVAFDRQGAADWALSHVHDASILDPACAYFVSDALRLGGGMTTTERWFPGVRPSRIRRWHRVALSRSYGCVGDFAVELRASGRARLCSVDTHVDVVDARIGDVLLYNWDGLGRYQHMAIVTDVVNGVPLVTQQSPAQRNRQWNRKGDGSWIHTAALLRILTDSPDSPGSPDEPGQSP